MRKMTCTNEVDCQNSYYNYNSLKFEPNINIADIICALFVEYFCLGLCVVAILGKNGPIFNSNKIKQLHAVLDNGLREFHSLKKSIRQNK